MNAFLLALVLAADPPKENPPTPPKNPAATAVAALNFGERTTFLGRPRVFGEHAALLFSAAAAEVAAKAKVPGDPRRVEVRPILTQGDPEAPRRMLVEIFAETDPGGDPEKYLRAVCDDVEKLLRGLAEDDLVREAKLRERREAELRELQHKDALLTAVLDVSLRGLSPDEGERLIAEKTREREAAEAALAAARERLKALNSHAPQMLLDPIATETLRLRVELQELSDTHGDQHPKLKTLRSRIKTLEALTVANANADAAPPWPPKAAGDLPRMTLDAQLREAEAALALRLAPDAARLAKLQEQLNVLRERHEVRRRRLRLEETSASAPSAASSDVSVRILRLRKGS